jgi:XapX domain-containing protein
MGAEKMGKLALGCAISLAIGAMCRWVDIPLPSPPKIQGALLVVAMTLGYLATDWVIAREIPPEGPQQHSPFVVGRREFHVRQKGPENSSFCIDHNQQPRPENPK